MRTMKRSVRAGLSAFVVSLLANSCFSELSSTPMGSIQIQFEELPATTKTSNSIPETDDFILSVTGAKGDIIYKGRFGDSPESIEAPAGTYTVSAYSCEFSKPAFDCPQYGDTQVVVVQAGKSVSVLLSCVQLNAGIKLAVDRSFMEAFPEGMLNLKGADGSLDYDYDETRIAFFTPGNISLSVRNGSSSEVLFSRLLGQQQILSVSVSASLESGPKGHVEIQLDTSRNWSNERYTYGKGGTTPEGAYSIAEAKDHIGQENAWVCGYIVGVFPTTGKVSSEQPFTRNTNIAIASRSSTTDKDYCLSVELPAGAIREALNLVDNPGNLGRFVYLRGSIAASYYGVPGIKGLTEYQWKK